MTIQIQIKGDLDMNDYKKSLNKHLKDPDFKKEWDDREIEYQDQAELIRDELTSSNDTNAKKSRP